MFGTGGAGLFLIGGGAVYLVLWIYGLVIDMDSAANFVPLNTADNWLHFFLGVGMIGVGAALRRAGAHRTAQHDVDTEHRAGRQIA